MQQKTGFGGNANPTGRDSHISNRKKMRMENSSSLLIALHFGNFRRKIHKLQRHKSSVLAIYGFLPGNSTDVNRTRNQKKLHQSVKNENEGSQLD